MTVIINAEATTGPGSADYLVDPEDGEYTLVSSVEIGGQYAAFTGDFEMECSEWEVTDDTLRITP